MKFDISAEVRFAFCPSLEQIDALIELASHHYDSKCKSTGKDIHIPDDDCAGMLPKWKRIINSYNGELPTEYQPIKATWRQLDILLKIMEENRHVDDKAKKEMLDELAMDFILAMNAARAAHGQWHLSVDTSETDK